jgi:hypothetical protein
VTTAGPPHADTLRSWAWVDLAGGPLVLSVPETHGRFYVIAMLDLWTNVFACVGARTTGTHAARFALHRLGQHAGALPADLFPIVAPTRFARLAALTQADDGEDLAAAHAVQDGFGLERQPSAGPAAPAAEPPVPAAEEIERMDAGQFFHELERLMRDNPAHLEDRPMLDRMHALGLLSGWERLDDGVRRAIAAGARRGLERVHAAAQAPPGDAVGDWRIRFRRGAFGTDYLARAAAACAQLELGSAADDLPAVLLSDADGRSLTGDREYRLRFAPGRQPPVHGFWSLTTCDSRRRPYAVRDWNRFALDPDGALPVVIAHRPPLTEPATNWLPAPAGAFSLVLRLCWPQQPVFDRTWTPPPVTRLASAAPA